MTLSVDDYEKAIARIFDANGNVIGTGFLIAPGYVLTCAHVVLQAIGVAKEKFAEYLGQPQEPVTLDFHVLASGQPIEAQVVAWMSYDLDSGDVAALRLTSSAPVGAKPVPLETVSRAEVENEPHMVYGFGRSASGGRSDAYRPKANVAGGRFQLCKVGDPNDETIKPGFSGAPVWNEPRRCVIGMVATAVVAQNDQQSLAYSIPTQALQPVLKQVAALTLHDVLQQGLDNCVNEDERDRLNRTIENVLQRCNPNGGNRSWLNQLIDLALERPPVIGWEAESPLIYFAVMLAWTEDTPGQVYDQLSAWVEQQNVEFPVLLARLTRAMREKQFSPNKTCEHLIVMVDPVETSDQAEFEISIWAIAEPATNLTKPSPQLLLQDKICTLKPLPQKIRNLIRDKLGKVAPVIHLFLPRDQFNQGIEMEPRNKRTLLGSEYSCVLRSNPNACPSVRAQYYQDDLRQKWDQVQAILESLAKEVLTTVDCQQSEDDLFDMLESTCAALLTNCDDPGNWFETVSEEVALPVALWSRDPKYQDDFKEVLFKDDPNNRCVVKMLPEYVRQARHGAHRAKNTETLGYHLSLVWEDPNVVPPDMQFDPEAC